MNVGIEVDMNLTQLTNVPISVILGYRYSSFPGNRSMLYFDHNIFFGQFSYIGREDFIISLNFTLSRETSDIDENITWPNALELYMRYIF